MTTEQLKELVEVLSVLSAKSSVLQERDELRHLMEENQQAASEETEVLLSLIWSSRAPTNSCPTNRTLKPRHS
jgi:hypothetical protein